MSTNKVKVLYIAGWGRSGSTLLENILGQVDGFVSVGELRYIWERGLIENRSCSCGAQVRECEFWNPVLREAFDVPEHIDLQLMLQMGNAVRTRHVPLLLLPGRREQVVSRVEPYLEHLDALYRAIHSHCGARVIIDSSKSPAYACLLQTIPAIDLYVVHLVRDSRAVAYSWLRRVPQPDTPSREEMPRFNPVKSALLWIAMNITTELAFRRVPGRYIRLRYEEFIDRPRETFKQILDLLHEPVASMPFVGEREVELAANHAISGNPMRFKSGAVMLERDREWEKKMKGHETLGVTALTWPLLRRYGYAGRLRA